MTVQSHAVGDRRDIVAADARTTPKTATLKGGTLAHGLNPDANIFDIRLSKTQTSLSDSIKEGLAPPNGGEKRLPTLLLYDEAGLKLFEDITYLDEYYLTNTEIKLLEAHADDIAREIKPGSIVLELGSGNLRKVKILLDAIDRLGKAVDYYALDLSLDELVRTLAAVPPGTFKHVSCFGLWGTYDDGLVWLQRPQISNRSKVVLSLGSSIGNFKRSDAASFIRGFADALGAQDCMLFGIDACKDPERVYHAYNDSQGLTHRFVLNGLVHANKILGDDVFDLNKWTVVGEYDAEAGRHQAFVVPSDDTNVLGVQIKAGEKIRIEESYKYGKDDTARLLHNAGTREASRWSNRVGDYALHMIVKKSHALPWRPEEYATVPVPTWEEWQALWKLWDAVTRQMLPDDELLEKPIKLRNACIFYLGHIPTFFDIKLTGSTNGVPTHPKQYWSIFERGIDPDVDNPEQCHAHSDVPDEWPPVKEILEYQGRVRQRVKSLYDSGEASQLKVGRCLWLGYEHEAMHLETLLYMLVQSERTLPPPTTARPNFDVIAQQDERSQVENKWFDIPAQTITLGMDDPDADVGPMRYFGWDIEKPPRKVHVPSFIAKARPITNGEYAAFLENTGKTKLPASWIEKPKTNGYSNGHGDHQITSTASTHYLSNKAVRTVYGPVPLSYAQHWPLSASYEEIEGCAAYMGGRIPTLEEARSIYTYVDAQKRDQADQALSKTIPAVNSHLVNDGVEESPPQNGHLNGSAGSSSEDPYSQTRDALFSDLKGCNVGFQRWYPASVTQNGGQLAGQAGMGGLWEWTSTPLSKQPGYEPMPLYPAYSSDFFDGKHNIVLGGSWATVPRIAGRKSFTNWYQRNYPYVWAGARLVKDC